MILIINICKESLHELEFVKPIQEIVKSLGLKYKVRHYKELKQSEIKEAKKIIICGTSLKDNDFLEDLREFTWIEKFDRPILGICGGMQIIGMSFRNGRIEDQKQIGPVNIKFKEEFLGMKDVHEVFELHQKFVIPNMYDFKILSVKKCAQVIKHRKKPIYGVLFHPEVRNKEMIINFLNLK